MSKTNLPWTVGIFLAADFVAWRLSFGKLYAIQAGKNPDMYASLEGALACLGLLCGVDLAGNLDGWKRWAFVVACGIVPIVARRLSV